MFVARRVYTAGPARVSCLDPRWLAVRCMCSLCVALRYVAMSSMYGGALLLFTLIRCDLHCGAVMCFALRCHALRWHDLRYIMLLCPAATQLTGLTQESAVLR